MTKQEIIERIVDLNSSARREFLSSFNQIELQDYLAQLESEFGAGAAEAKPPASLSSSAEPVESAEFIADLINRSASDPTVMLDIVETLHHGGFVAEQAALTLYRRTGTPLPEDRTKMDLNAASWRKRVRSWLLTLDMNIEVRLAKSADPS